MSAEVFIANPPPPLQTVIPAYPYQQYADDPNVVAFFTAYNTLAQGYLNWMNQDPLALYTSPNITGQLLDWIGNGIYGVPRPVFSTLVTSFDAAALGGVALDTIEIDGSLFSSSGTAIVANDDFYKRTLTWMTYAGDGRTVNAMMLRRRVARFLYGINGGDITVTQAQNVDISVHTGPLHYLIKVPAAAGVASNYFQEAYNSGILTFPFMVSATVSVV